MRTEIRSAIALNGPLDRVFGTTRWIDGDVLRFETHGGLEVGDRYDVRLELAGAYDSVQARVQVVDTVRFQEEGPLTCTAVIERMTDADRASMAVWVEERSVSQSLGSGTTAGRARVSRALRASLQRSREAAHSTWDFEEGGRQEVKIEACSQADLHLSPGGTVLTARWVTASALARDWETGLGEGVLEGIATGPPPSQGTRLTVQLQLPQGKVLVGRGIALAPRGLRCRVQLTLTEAMSYRLQAACAA